MDNLSDSVSQHQLADDLPQRKKVKTVGKSSVGNFHKFPQQTRTSRDSSASLSSSSLERSDFYINGQIQRDISNLTDCCAKGKGLFGGCLLKHFGYHEDVQASCTSKSDIERRETAITAATEYIKIYREQGVAEVKKDKTKRDVFIQEIFRGCILSETLKENGKKRFEMQYEIPSIDNKLGKKNKIEVCVRTLQCVYDISAYEWRLCNEVLRESSGGRVSSLRHQPWKDDFLHDATYAEVENVFQRNLKDCVIPSK